MKNRDNIVDKEDILGEDEIYIYERESGGEYKTNEMNEYRNNYSNNDCKI